jgi:hypothetical protein
MTTVTAWQASELYDPRTDILRAVLDDDPLAFPPPHFATPEWLTVSPSHPSFRRIECVRRALRWG